MYSSSKRGRYQFVETKEATKSNAFDTKQQLSLFRISEIKQIFPECANMCKGDAIGYLISKYSTDAINKAFKETLKSRLHDQWSFLENNRKDIFEIDYQWFYQSQTKPALVYGT